MSASAAVSQRFKKFDPSKSVKLTTLALSDLHLGRSITHAQAPEIIAPLVEGFERVLLLGDIVDHWYTSAQEAKDFEDRIRRVCKSAGVKEIIYFRGNHDACQEDGEEYALLNGVLYLHGHAVYHKLHGEGCATDRIKTLNDKKFGAHRTQSRANHPGWDLIERMYGRIPMPLMIPFKFPWHVRVRIKTLVDEVAPTGGVRAVVLGHSHRPGIQKHRGMTLFNLGGWIKNTKAYGFVHDDDNIKLVQIDTTRSEVKWGRVLYDGKC